MHVAPNRDSILDEEREWAEWLADHGVSFDHTKEDLVPLPSGGVFAEAVLGRYNSAEKLDITRFWNWQDSSIPLQAPEITAIQTGSRGTTEDLKSGQFSQPLVNIVNPTSLPDPIGMGAILTAISNGNMFRDMSGLAATIGLAQAGLQATSEGAGRAGAQAGANHGHCSTERSGDGQDSRCGDAGDDGQSQCSIRLRRKYFSARCHD
jgi:hypothetical protein